MKTDMILQASGMILNCGNTNRALEETRNRANTHVSLSIMSIVWSMMQRSRLRILKRVWKKRRTLSKLQNVMCGLWLWDSDRCIIHCLELHPRGNILTRSLPIKIYHFRWIPLYTYPLCWIQPGWSRSDTKYRRIPIHSVIIDLQCKRSLPLLKRISAHQIFWY